MNKLWKINVANSEKFLSLNPSSINKKLLAEGESTLFSETVFQIQDCLRLVDIDKTIIKSVLPDDVDLIKKTRSHAKLTGFLLNVAWYIDYLNPKKWANETANKLLTIKIDTIEKLKTSIDDKSLQTELENQGQVKFHKMTISIMTKAIDEGLPDDLTFIQEKIQDFQHGGQ